MSRNANFNAGILTKKVTKKYNRSKNQTEFSFKKAECRLVVFAIMQENLYGGALNA